MSGCLQALMGGGFKFGTLAGSMNLSGTSGTKQGLIDSAAAGGITVSLFSSFGTCVDMYDDSSVNQLVITITTAFGNPDPNINSWGSFTMNSLTFFAGNPASFVGGVGTGTWRFANGGTRVTGLGRAYAFT